MCRNSCTGTMCGVNSIVSSWALGKRPRGSILSKIISARLKPAPTVLKRFDGRMRALMCRLLPCVALVASLLSAHDADLASRAVSLLEQRCFVCHGAALAQSGLRLNSRESALQGGVRGPAIVPGNASQSRVVQAIRRTGELSMPPGPKLAEAEIATIEKRSAD